VIILGIDGGGTKTEFLMTDHCGKILAHFCSGGCRFHKDGVSGVLEMLRQAAGRLEEESGVPMTHIAYTVAGMPVVEENARIHKEIMEGLQALFPGGVSLYGDAFTCLFGSLGGKNGINIIAGTGSVCSGTDGKSYARCGGWSASLCDEGSCHWVARKTYEVFTKEADGRLEITPIYGLIRDYFGTNRDMEIGGLFNKELYLNRDKMAGVQTVTEQAFLQGDPHAARIYRQAVEEICLMVETVHRKLHFEGKAQVSYSGGLFRAKHVPELLGEVLDSDRFFLRSPCFTPVQGSLLLAAKQCLDNGEYAQFLAMMAEHRDGGGEQNAEN